MESTISTVHGKMLKSKDGTNIYADAVGDPSKPAVVFIHGSSMSSIVWNIIFSDSKWINSVYMVRYDLRGHGRSGMPTDEASWESQRLAEDFDAVVEAFSLVKPFVLGWSLGGTFIADILAFRPPTDLAGIIYAGALPYLGPAVARVCGPKGLELVPGVMQSTDVNKYQENARALLDLIFSRSAGTSYGPGYDFPFYLACLAGFMVQPRAMTPHLLARTQDASGLLEAGRTGALSLLVIHGKRDELVLTHEVVDIVTREGWKQEKLEVVDLEKGGHFMWLDEPEKFREVVLDWVERVWRSVA